MGVDATKSCVRVRLRRKEQQSGGADKGANPRTGSASVAPGGGKQGRPAQELAGNVPRTAGRSLPPTWTTTVTRPSYGSAPVHRVVLEVAPICTTRRRSDALLLLVYWGRVFVAVSLLLQCFLLRESGPLILKSTLDSCTSSPSQSCDSRQQQLVAATPQLRAAMASSYTCDSTVAGMLDAASTPLYTGPSTCTVFPARVLRFFFGSTGFSSHCFSAVVPAAVVRGN